ncbi:hypothetical protein AMATHDRAFT_66051 [Amanita thiersii Skay4041]|uniref:PWWP domain-containing protein n=1 Tax=Amanita thiersii Skay4041 TaxID=703135 RepID=A0A2A9NC71_9AGAR|nr:hypothetical protein AMATHDRAFT_66051 [Amanita thiersii Skay4041]
MPSSKTRTYHTLASYSDRSAASLKLRPVSTEELQLYSWSDAESDDGYIESDLLDLNETRPYKFQSGDSVWVRTTGGDWYPGKVSGLIRRKGRTREGEGIFYPVTFFHGKVRKYFAPLNGDIKPDTEHVRSLLKAGGWL